MPERLPSNAGGVKIPGVLYMQDPDGGAVVAVPVLIDRYIIGQHSRIRRSTGRVETDDTMSIEVYGTALGIIHDPGQHPWSTDRSITEGE
jgi:hypothetical protein